MNLSKISVPASSPVHALPTNTINTGDLISISNEEYDLVCSYMVKMVHSSPWDIRRIAGGVSSNVWLVRDADDSYVVKQPLSRLRVQTSWHAPLERSTYEYRWLRMAAQCDPRLVPPIVSFEPDRPLLVTRYLPPTAYPIWQRSLFDGNANAIQAGSVGRALVALHAHTAGKAHSQASFKADQVLLATRIEPYFFATALRHPPVASTLRAIGESVLIQGRAVIHGDVSPKNILLGPAVPVFLDAECACYADPAFDLAFCLTHLLLKQVAVTERRAALHRDAQALVHGYSAGVAWESAAALLARCAVLLPALMLARIDGKVPVSYLAEKQREAVRAFALKHLDAATNDLEHVMQGLSELAASMTHHRAKGDAFDYAN